MRPRGGHGYVAPVELTIQILLCLVDASDITARPMIVPLNVINLGADWLRYISEVAFRIEVLQHTENISVGSSPENVSIAVTIHVYNVLLNCLCIVQKYDDGVQVKKPVKTSHKCLQVLLGYVG